MSKTTFDEVNILIKKCTKGDYSKPLEAVAAANGELGAADKEILLSIMANGNNAKKCELKKKLGEYSNPNVDKPEYIDDYVFVMSHNCYYNIKTLTQTVEKALDTAFDELQIVINGDTKYLKPSKAFKFLKGICVMTVSWHPTPYGEDTKSISVLQNGETFLNRYRPPMIKPVKGSVKLFIDLVAYLVPDKTVRELLLDWMAFTLRYPNIKINWQILFIGQPRIGKDAIFKPLFNIMGSASGEASNAELEEGFTDYLLDTKFLTIQEIHHPRNKKVQALIKGYTASTASGLLRVNPKFGKKIEFKNLLSVVAFSNFDDAIQIDEHDDRFLVINSRVPRKSDDYYKKYFDWIDKENGIEKVMSFLLVRDVSKFNHGALPVRTDAYHALVKEGRPHWVQSLEVVIDNSEGPFSKNYVTVKQVTNYVNEYLINMKFTVSEKLIATKLHEFGFDKLKRGTKKIRGQTKTTPRYWARGELLKLINSKTSRQVYDYFSDKKGNHDEK